MTIRKTNFKQLRLNSGHFADGEDQTGRDDPNGAESTDPGEICLRADLDDDSDIFHESGASNNEGAITENLLLGGVTPAVTNAKLLSRVGDGVGEYKGIESDALDDLITGTGVGAVLTDEIENFDPTNPADTGVTTGKIHDYQNAKAFFSYAPGGGAAKAQFEIAIRSGSELEATFPGSLSNNLNFIQPIDGTARSVNSATGDITMEMDVSGGETLNDYLNRIDSFLIDGARQFQPTITADPSNVANTAFSDPSEITIVTNFGSEFDGYGIGQGILTSKFENSTVGVSNTDGVTSAKLAVNAVIEDKIQNAAVTTDKLEDSTGAADGVTTNKFATDAVTSDKLESADTTSTNKARIDVAIGGGPSGTIIVEADASYNGVVGSLLRIEIENVDPLIGGGGGAVFDADDYLITLTVKEGNDDVADIIGYLSGLANFTASSSTIVGADRLVTIANISELSVHALASGIQFCDRSPDENTDAAELAASGIQSVKFGTDLENSDFSTSAINRRVIAPFGTAGNSYGELLMVEVSSGVGDVVASRVKPGNLTAKGNHASSNGENALDVAGGDGDNLAHDYSRLTKLGDLQAKLASELTLQLNKDNAAANGLNPSDASDVGLEMTSDTADAAEHHISGLPTAAQIAGSPWSAQDLVTKEYVESVGAGSQWKEPVRLASNEDFTGATEAAGVLELHPGGSSGDGTLMFDGKSLRFGDRVLFFGMSGANAGLNGIYGCSRLGVSKHFKIIYDLDNAGNHANDIIELHDAEFQLDMFDPNGNQSLKFVLFSNAQYNAANPGAGVNLVTGDAAPSGGSLFVVQLDGTSSMDDIAFEMDSLFGQSFSGAHLQDKLFTEATVQNGLVEFKVSFMHQSAEDALGEENTLRMNNGSQNNQVTLQLGDSGFDFSSMPGLVAALSKMTGGVKGQFRREEDADSAEEIIGLGVFIEEGDYYSDVAFHCTSPDSEAGFVLNTSALAFVQKTAIGMHQGDNVGIEIQPNAKSIRIKDLGLKVSDLEMSIVRKHIRGFYNNADPVNIELGIEGGSDDVAIVKEGGVETILSDLNNNDRYLVFSKYAYEENVFDSAGANLLASPPVTGQQSLVGNPNPLLDFAYHQVFLNGVLLKHASGIPMNDGDYVLIEGDNTVLFNTGGSEDPSNPGNPFGDNIDEFASSVVGIRGPEDPSNVSIGANPPTSISDSNALVIKIHQTLLSPGDILEFRIWTRHRYTGNIGGFNQ